METSNLTEYFIEYYMNHTDTLPEYYRTTAVRVCGGLITLLIALVAFIGNFAVIIVSFWQENLRTQTGNFLIVFLAAIDVITSIFVMIPSAITMAIDFWPFGQFSCRMNAMFNYTCACSSSHTASMISFDRALAIKYSLKYQAIMTSKFMVGILTWIVINAGFLLILLITSIHTISYDYSEAVCATTYSEHESQTNLKVNIGAFTCFVVPAVIIATCNTLIVLQIRRSSKVMPQLATPHGSIDYEQYLRRKRDMRMRKSVYSMMAIVTVYFICFSPYSVGKMGKAITGADAPPWLNYVSTIMMFISSATNPFIYGILRKDYRDGFKRIVRLLQEKCSSA